MKPTTIRVLLVGVLAHAVALASRLCAQATWPRALGHVAGSRGLKAGVLCNVVLAFATSPTPGSGQPPASAVDDPSAIKEFLLQGMAERGAALKSALFSARGQKKGATGDDKNDIANGDVFIHGAIDGARLRFDYGEPAFVLAPENVAKPIRDKANLTREQVEQLAKETAESLKSRPEFTKKDLVLSRTETFFIRSPVKNAYWYNGNPNIFLVAANGSVPEGVRRFDVNALGLYGWLEFQQGPELNELLDSYRANKRFEVKDLGGGAFSLVFLFDGPLTSSRWEMDIDTLHGFTPTRSRLVEFNNKQSTTAIRQSSETTWKQVKSVWVPETFKIWQGEAPGEKEAKVFSSLALTFAFDRINQPIDEAEFSYKSFPAPAFASVLDNSTLDPLLIRQAAESGSASQGALHWIKNRKTPILVALDVLIVLALLGVLWRRASRRDQSTKI
jgi:hypothetical protein